MKRTAIIAAVVLAMVMGIVAYAYAVDSSPVTVSATVGQRIRLTLSTTSVSFGNVLPEDVDSANVTLTVQSNAPYTITRNVGAGDNLASLLGLNVTGAASGAKLKSAAGADYTDAYAIDVPWTTDPGTYTNTYTYTVVP